MSLQSYSEQYDHAVDLIKTARSLLVESTGITNPTFQEILIWGQSHGVLTQDEIDTIMRLFKPHW